MPGRTKTRGGEASSQPPEEYQPDTSMVDAAADEIQEEFMEGVEGEGAEEEEEEEPRVRILAGSLDKAASFEFLEEGHTLGNALRWVIMKNPDVEFCAYTIPHPSEAKMNIRIQTYEGLAVDALQKGLQDLSSMCDVMTTEFAEKMSAFDSSKVDV